jgi:hypothetical protein
VIGVVLDLLGTRARYERNFHAHRIDDGEYDAQWGADPVGEWRFYPTAFDVLLRAFLLRARDVLTTAGISSPLLLKAKVQSPFALAALDEWGAVFNGIPAREFEFPALQIDSLLGAFEKSVRPLCDQFHQIFGWQGSPCFTADGTWQDSHH